MKKIIWILAIFSFISCKKDKTGNFFLKYKEKSYGIIGARLLRQEFITGTNLQSFNLYFYSKNISFNMAEEKGHGTILKLELQVDSSRLRTGDYDISNQVENYTIVKGKKDKSGSNTGSYFKHISADKANPDTIFTFLKGGKLLISPTKEKEHNNYRLQFINSENDSVSGVFEGSCLFQNNVDGIKVGEISIGDSIYGLQRGDMMQWGTIFMENVNYYELFFYSTSMRTTENGKFCKGLVFVLGLHSVGENEPKNGTYPLSRSYADKTALTGRKENGIDWGSYWYAYTSSTAIQKAFITKNNISIEKKGKLFDIKFSCTDQLGDSIKGNYLSDFKVINLRK